MRLPDSNDIDIGTPRGTAAVTDRGGPTMSGAIGVGLRGAAEHYDRKAKFQEATARARFEAARIEIEGEFDQDRDFETMGDRFDQRMREKLGELGETISSKSARTAFFEQAEVSIASGAERIKGKAFDVEKDLALASLNEDLNRITNTALETGDYDGARIQMEELLGGAVEATYLSAEDAGATDRAFDDVLTARRISSAAPEDRLGLLDEIGGNLSLEARDKITQNAQLELYNQLRLDQYENGSDRELYEQLAADDKITGDHKLSLMQAADQQEAAELSEQNRIYSEQLSKNLMTLELRASDGTLTRADADMALDGGMIDQAGHLKLAKLLATQSQKNSDALTFQQQLLGSGFIDPYSTEDKKNADAYWESIGGTALLVQDPENGEASLRVIAQTGILPSSLASDLTSIAIRGPDEQQVGALTMIAGLSDDYPLAVEQAFRGKSAALLSEAQEYRRRVALGASPEESLEIIKAQREESLNFNEGTFDRRKKRINTILEELDDTNWQKGMHKKWAGFTEDAELETLVLMDDLASDAARNSFVYHGDEERALRDAKDMLGRVFGKTKVGGKTRTVFLPPEQIFDLPPEALEDMVLSDPDLQALMGGDIKPKDFRIVGTSGTLESFERGEPPLYRIEVKRGNQIEMFDDFYFDPETIQAAQRGEYEGKRAEFDERLSRSMEKRADAAEKRYERGQDLQQRSSARSPQMNDRLQQEYGFTPPPSDSELEQSRQQAEYLRKRANANSE